MAADGGANVAPTIGTLLPLTGPVNVFDDAKLIFGDVAPLEEEVAVVADWSFDGVRNNRGALVPFGDDTCEDDFGDDTDDSATVDT
jgi:hypothetical protein